MLGTNHAKSVGMKCRKREEMVQKAIEESGENGRKHVIKKAGQNTVKIYKREESVITTRIKGAKSIGTWRKPERLLGTNYDDAVDMLEKHNESAGKCDNNQRKWCKNDRKLKETGKTLGNIY